MTARHFGLSPSTLTEQSRRFLWKERAAAWDTAQAASTVVLPMPPNKAATLAADQQGLDDEHWAALEEFRQEAEQLGRAQIRLAKGLSAAATRSAARLIQSNKELAPRDIAALASTSAQLASSGTQLWARAIGLDQLMAGMEHLARQAAAAEC